MRRTRWCALTLAAVACGGREDRIALSDSGEGCNRCLEEVTVVADASVPGPSGIAVASALDAVGTYQGTLSWGSPGTPGLVEASTTAMILEVAATGGGGRDFRTDIEDPCRENGVVAEGNSCCDRVELDATVTLTLGDGSLTESWLAPLQHRVLCDPRGNSFELVFGPDDTAGTLSSASFTPFDAAWSIDTLTLYARFDDAAVTGELVIAQVSSWGTVDPRRVATFGGVSEPTPAACGSLTTADACAGAGCFPITGRAVHRLEGGDDACTCSDLTTLLCTADPFEGTPEPSLYLHRWTTPEGTRRELAYQLPVLTDTPPAPFVRCEDAPSTEGCVCLQAPLACP